jgi:hypothetical protein
VSEHYLVERYWPGVDRDQLTSAATRLGTAVRELAVRGREVRVLNSVFIPADEVVLSLFEATTEDDVVEVNRRSGVPFDRVQQVEVCSPRPLRGNHARSGDFGTP